MRADAASLKILITCGALIGCSEDHTPMHKVLQERFKTGAVIDLSEFVPGRWSAICLHGQYETVRATGPSSVPLNCTGDEIPVDSGDNRISYISYDDRCFSIAMPNILLDTRTECYRERDGFRFRMEATPAGKMIKHVAND